MKLTISNLRVVMVLVGLLTAGAVVSAAPSPLQLLSLGRVDEAIQVLVTRDDAESVNQLSRAYYATEHWEDAVKSGERAVSLRPGDSNFHLWLAREYGMKAGEANPLVAANLARKAKGEFERAVQLDTSNVAARSDLSEYYIEAPVFMGGGLDKARDTGGPNWEI